MSRKGRQKIVVSLDEVHRVAGCVASDIGDAKAYDRMVFKLVNGLLEDRSLKEDTDEVLWYMHEAFVLHYVMSLAKLFDHEDMPSLCRLINVTREFLQRADRQAIDRQRSELLPKNRPRMDRAGRQFLEQSTYRIREVRRIRGEISPLRNVYRAHNYPDRPTGTRTGVEWRSMRVWLRLAENVYGQALLSVGEGRFVVQHLPGTLETAISNFLLRFSSATAA
jgi:hypothetical protein